MRRSRYLITLTALIYGCTGRIEHSAQGDRLYIHPDWRRAHWWVSLNNGH